MLESIYLEQHKIPTMSVNAYHAYIHVCCIDLYVCMHVCWEYLFSRVSNLMAFAPWTVCFVFKINQILTDWPSSWKQHWESSLSYHFRTCTNNIRYRISYKCLEDFLGKGVFQMNKIETPNVQKKKKNYSF